MLVPFQFDLCHFRNLIKRDPANSCENLRLIIEIRRNNLDTFWTREDGIVTVTRINGSKLCNDRK